MSVSAVRRKAKDSMMTATSIQFGMLLMTESHRRKYELHEGPPTSSTRQKGRHSEEVFKDLIQPAKVR